MRLDSRFRGNDALTPVDPLFLLTPTRIPEEQVFSLTLEDNQWREASIDLRLGFSFTCLRKALAGVRVRKGGSQ